jgi:hypothetical protein
LPSREGRSHFFYLEDYYRHEAGCGETIRLSIWRWLGRNAVQRFAKEYPSFCEAEEPRFDGGILHVYVKREYKMAVSVAASAGRATDWRIAVGPHGVTDLGETPEQPETDLIDELMYRIAKGAKAEKLAAPAVIAFVRKHIAKPGVRFDTRSFPLDYGRSRVTRRARDTAFCLEIGGNQLEYRSYLFSITRVGDHPFVAGVETPSTARRERLCPHTD